MADGVTEQHTHDPESWDHGRVLDMPEYHMHEALRNKYHMLYWLMRIGDRALEVGAGSGISCMLLKRLCPKKVVVATDITDHSCQVMRDLAKSLDIHVPVQKADTLALPFEDKSFDIVFSEGMLEHYEDDWILAALREQARVGDAVLVSVPLEFYMLTFRSAHGDERLMHKMEWLDLLTQVGRLSELCLLGPPTEEYWLIGIIDTSH